MINHRMLFLLVMGMGVAVTSVAGDCNSIKFPSEGVYAYMDEVFATNAATRCGSANSCSVLLPEPRTLQLAKIKSQSGCDLSTWILTISVQGVEKVSRFGSVSNGIYEIHLPGLTGNQVNVTITSTTSCDTWKTGDHMELYSFTDSTVDVAVDSGASCVVDCNYMMDSDFSSTFKVEISDEDKVLEVKLDRVYTLIYFRLSVTISADTAFSLSLQKNALQPKQYAFEMTLGDNVTSTTYWVYQKLPQWEANHVSLTFETLKDADVGTLNIKELELYSDLSQRVNAARQEGVACRASSKANQSGCRRAIDGQLTPKKGEWVSDKEGVGLWYSLQLPRPYSLSLIRIIQRYSSEESSKDLRLYFGGGNCAEVTMLQSKGQPDRYGQNAYNDPRGHRWHVWRLDGVITRNVNISVLSVYTTGSNGFMEIELYGTPSLLTDIPSTGSSTKSTTSKENSSESEEGSDGTTIDTPATTSATTSINLTTTMSSTTKTTTITTTTEPTATSADPISTTYDPDGGMRYNVTMRISNLLFYDGLQNPASEEYLNFSPTILNLLSNSLPVALGERYIDNIMELVFRNGSIVSNYLFDIKGSSPIEEKSVVDTLTDTFNKSDMTLDPNGWTFTHTATPEASDTQLLLAGILGSLVTIGLVGVILVAILMQRYCRQKKKRRRRQQEPWEGSNHSMHQPRPTLPMHWQNSQSLISLTPHGALMAHNMSPTNSYFGNGSLPSYSSGTRGNAYPAQHSANTYEYVNWGGDNILSPEALELGMYGSDLNHRSLPNGLPLSHHDDEINAVIGLDTFAVGSPSRYHEGVGGGGRRRYHQLSRDSQSRDDHNNLWPTRRSLVNGSHGVNDVGDRDDVSVWSRPGVIGRDRDGSRDQDIPRDRDASHDSSDHATSSRHRSSTTDNAIIADRGRHISRYMQRNRTHSNSIAEAHEGDISLHRANPYELSNGGVALQRAPDLSSSGMNGGAPLHRGNSRDVSSSGMDGGAPLHRGNSRDISSSGMDGGAPLHRGNSHDVSSNGREGGAPLHRWNSRSQADDDALSLYYRADPQSDDGILDRIRSSVSLRRNVERNDPMIHRSPPAYYRKTDSKRKENRIRGETDI